jgi:hypothetical protein
MRGANPRAADRAARGWSPEGRIPMTPYRPSNYYPFSVCLIMATTYRRPTLNTSCFSVCCPYRPTACMLSTAHSYRRLLILLSARILFASPRRTFAPKTFSTSTFFYFCYFQKTCQINRSNYNDFKEIQSKLIFK